MTCMDSVHPEDTIILYCSFFRKSARRVRHTYRFQERQTHLITRIKTKHSQTAQHYFQTETSIMCISTHPYTPHNLVVKRKRASRKRISEGLRQKKGMTPLNLNGRGGSISFKKKLATVTNGAIR